MNWSGDTDASRIFEWSRGQWFSVHLLGGLIGELHPIDFDLLEFFIASTVVHDLR